MEIKDFLETTKQQYVDLLISSGISKEKDRTVIMAKMAEITHGRIVPEQARNERDEKDQRDLGDGRACVVIEDENGKNVPRILLKRENVGGLESVSDVNSPTLDKLRQDMFHELTHVLQYDKEYSQNVGYNIEDEREGKALNEATAQMAEQLVMLEYYKKVRGLQNAGIVSKPLIENGMEMTASNVVPDTTQIGQGQSFSGGTYSREVSLVRSVCSKMGIGEKSIIANSFSFNSEAREKGLASQADNFNKFCYDLCSVHLHNSSEHRDLISEEEYVDAIKAIQGIGNSSLKEAQNYSKDYANPSTIDGTRKDDLSGIISRFHLTNHGLRVHSGFTSDEKGRTELFNIRKQYRQKIAQEKGWDFEHLSEEQKAIVKQEAMTKYEVPEMEASIMKIAPYLKKMPHIRTISIESNNGFIDYVKPAFDKLGFIESDRTSEYAEHPEWANPQSNNHRYLSISREKLLAKIEQMQKEQSTQKQHSLPPEQQQTTTGFIINKFGEVIRGEQTQSQQTMDIPTFTPPEQQGPTVSRVSDEEISKVREEMGLTDSAKSVEHPTNKPKKYLHNFERTSGVEREL